MKLERLEEFDENDFEYLAEMASAGYFSLSIGQVEARVNPHEGMISHFHLRVVGKET